MRTLHSRRRRPLKVIFVLFVVPCCLIWSIFIFGMTIRDDQSKIVHHRPASKSSDTLWIETLSTIELRDADLANFDRIVIIGDLHGDLAQTLKVLQLTKIIDAHRTWIASRTVLVQTGDIVDRGLDSLSVCELFLDLRRQCDALGDCLVLNQLGIRNNK